MKSYRRSKTPTAKVKAIAELELRRRRSGGRRPSEPVTGLLDFICKTFPKYNPSWFHRAICDVCDRVIRGEMRRVILSVPPRNGKTEIISKRLPAYLFGENPNAQIISTSYSADLASKNNRAVQRIIDNKSYQELYPQTRLSGRNARSPAQFAYLRNNDEFEIVNNTGSYRCAGVGGGITGMGFGGEMTEAVSGFPIVGGIGIIDDYFKNRAEADSKTYREKVWEWYTSTFRTRCEDDAPIIVIATQWHEDGLIGRLISTAKADIRADQWEVIRFPAIAYGQLHPLDPRKVGDALWEEKYPLADLYKIQASVGGRDWESLYQQSPTPQGGNLFRLQDWNFYVDLPGDISQSIISVDAAFKESVSSDFVVVGVIAQQLHYDTLESGELIPMHNYYIIERDRARMGIVKTQACIKAMAIRHPECVTKLIEDKANGPAIIEQMSGQIPGITAYDPGRSSKLARATAVKPVHERGGLLLPLAGWAAAEVRAMGRDTITLKEWWGIHSPPHDRNAEHAPVAQWCKELMDESSDFPSGKNDDQVDFFVQAVNWLPSEKVLTVEDRLEILSR